MSSRFCLSKQDKLDISLTPRFFLPVAAENVFTILIGMVIAQVNSTISRSALAAIGMANSVMSVIMALFSMVITGGAVLVTRRVGEGNRAEAAKTVEQAMFLGILSSVLVTVISMFLAVELLTLLMPGAESSMIREAVRYFRMLMLSLPGYVVHGLLTNVSRAMDDSRTPLIATVLMNIGQVLLAWFFIGLLKLNEIGAGLAYVGCRLLGAGIMAVSIFGKKARISVSLKNMFRPEKEVCLHILKIGTPISLESIFVQLGYMLASTMSIGLGTFESGVYQIMCTLNNFSTSPQAVCAIISLTAVGHLIGGGKEKEARKAGRIVWIAGMIFTLVFSTVMILGSPLFAKAYTSDPLAVSAVSKDMWILLVMNIAGISINAVDPQLRAGGDVKFVMINTLVAVWLVRLPLTYLFAYVMDLGVLGIFLANVVSLWERAACGLIRKKGNRWIRRV